MRILGPRRVRLQPAVPGQQYDSVAGLNYNYFRDFDPAIGRYVESDPIGLLGGINTFAYALADPVNRLDPKGLQTPPGLRTLGGMANQAYTNSFYGKFRPSHPMAPPNGGFGLFGQFGAQGFAHLILVGGSIAIGVPFNVRGERCTAYTICLRLGPGAFIGAGRLGVLAAIATVWEKWVEAA